MKINIKEINISVKKIEGIKKNENLLATATLTLKEESGDYLVISGITIWKSKIDGKSNPEPPKNGFFKYCYGTLWQKIRKEIARQFEWEQIPVREDDPSIVDKKANP
jgi:hypothetical protein